VNRVKKPGFSLSTWSACVRRWGGIEATDLPAHDAPIYALSKTGRCARRRSCSEHEQCHDRVVHRPEKRCVYAPWRHIQRIQAKPNWDGV